MNRKEMEEFSDLELIRNLLIDKANLILNKIKDGVKYQITINVNETPFEQSLYFEKSVIGLYSFLYDQCYPSENPFPFLTDVNVLVLYDNTFYLRALSISIIEINDKEDEQFEEWIMLKKPEMNHLQSFTEFI